MKLRNKLAAVLATAMVVTSVPVVTMAATGNNISVSKLTVSEEGTEWRNAATAPALQIEFKNKEFSDMTTSAEIFYLELDNAEWLVDEASANKQLELTKQFGDTTVKFEKQASDIIKVTVQGIPVSGLKYGSGNNKIQIPILAKVTDKGDITLKLTSGGSSSTITEGSWVIAATSDEVGTAEVGSPKSFNKSGKIANITLKEAYTGSFKGYAEGRPAVTTGSAVASAVIELNDSDYEFDFSNAVGGGDTHIQKSGDNVVFDTSDGIAVKKYLVKAEYLYGFGGLVNLTANFDGAGKPASSCIEVYATKDKETLYVKLPQVNSDSKGQVKITGLAVKNAVKNPAKGDLTVDISGNIEDLKKAVVAKVGDYVATVKTEDDEIVDILAGQKEEVTFMIEEGIVGTFTEGREMDVKIENGYFVDAVLDEDKEEDEDATLTALQEAMTELEWTVDGDKEDDMEATAAITDYELDKDNRVIGFTLKPDVTKFDNGDVNGFKFKMDINTRVTDSGDVKLTVESRDLEETVEGTIAKAKAGLKVESTAAVLKVGLKDQVAGKLTITELEPEFLQKGEDLVIYLPKASMGILVDEDNLPTVKVTSGDIKLGDVDYKTGLRNKNGDKVDAIIIPVKQASDKAATIEITDFNFDVDRTAPEGSYDVYVGGKAVSEAETTVAKDVTNKEYKYYNQALTAENFIVIGTPNTEALSGSNGLTKGEVKFVIGETKYTAIDGTSKTMDAASYIQNPGFTMIPVRYVAEAFGVSESDILFSKGTATIFAGSRTIQLTSGSDVAIVNGASVTMGTKVTIKDGRTYVPVGEIARILGISTNWDAAAKTATFTNK